MWQFVTREADAENDLQISQPRKIGQIRHALTHRRYVFDVFLCQALTARLNGKWTTLKKLVDYPLPRPHLKIAQMLRDGE
jgi:adenine-specific DNA glycosylase